MNFNLARILICGVLCAAAMGSVNALAQTVSPDTPVNLNITVGKAEKIWRGLRKLPVEEVEELMNEIRQQVAQQTAPKPVVSSTEDKKDVPATSNTPN